MILVPGHNEAGNVLHIILGPESELYSDLHGAQVVDITPALSAFVADEPVYLSITRTKSERETIRLMADAGVLVGSTALHKRDGEPEAPKSKATSKHNKKGSDTCSYCKQTVPLVDIPMFKICKECAQIELGLQQRKAK